MIAGGIGDPVSPATTTLAIAGISPKDQRVVARPKKSGRDAQMSGMVFPRLVIIDDEGAQEFPEAYSKMAVMKTPADDLREQRPKIGAGDEAMRNRRPSRFAGRQSLNR